MLYHTNCMLNPLEKTLPSQQACESGSVLDARAISLMRMKVTLPLSATREREREREKERESERERESFYKCGSLCFCDHCDPSHRICLFSWMQRVCLLDLMRYWWVTREEKRREWEQSKAKKRKQSKANIMDRVLQVCVPFFSKY